MPSAPALSHAFAMAAISVTFGESFIKSGFLTFFRTARVIPAALCALVPKLIPPLSTLGQLIFTSIIPTLGLSSAILQEYTYSSSEKPPILAITFFEKTLLSSGSSLFITASNNPKEKVFSPAAIELYDELLPNAGVIASYLPAGESDAYNATSDFYGGQAVYKDIVEFAGNVPGINYGAYYNDIRSALTDAVTNVIQNNADIDEEIQNAQDTVEFNISE